ncbi:MAG: Holliday junction branch migration protein RuvA [Jiangellaceae bacterium]|nr:Holliday junction branch migration protein RuvA [Jiangellaceae bacterium]
MIAFVHGRVSVSSPGEVVLDVGGIGLTLQCTPTTAASLRPGDEARVPASLVVREDSLTLYGFADDDERTVFELLQTATGIGPRLAQAMLAVHPPDELRRIVAAEDLVALTRVPGVGRKGAQRIVIELRDKLGAPRAAAPPAGTGPDSGDGWQAPVHAALLGLGWTAREADAAIGEVAPMIGDGVDAADVATVLKAALRTLARP